MAASPTGKRSQDCESSQVSSRESINKKFIEEYWNSIDPIEYNKFLCVSIPDLVDFSCEGNLVGGIEEIIAESCSLYDIEGKWKCLKCWNCDLQFNDLLSYLGHIARNHIEDSLSAITGLLESLNHSIIHQITWRPLDWSLVVPMIEDYLIDASIKLDRGENIHEFDPMSYWLRDWPSVDDPIRKTLLEEIQLILRDFDSKPFMRIHVGRALVTALSKFQKFVPCRYMLEYKLNETHLCICVLNDTDLKEILDYLKRASSFYTKLMKGRPCSVDAVVIRDESVFKVLLGTQGEFRSEISGELLATWIYTPISPPLEKPKRRAKEMEVVARFQSGLKKQTQDITITLKIQRLKDRFRKLSSICDLFVSEIKTVADVDYEKTLAFLLQSYIKWCLEKSVIHNSDGKNINVEGGDLSKDTTRKSGSGEDTKKEKAGIEDVEKDLLSIQKEWVDAILKWRKSVLFIQDAVDKEEALAQFDSLKNEVVSLSDEFLEKASKSKELLHNLLR